MGLTSVGRCYFRSQPLISARIRAFYARFHLFTRFRVAETLLGRDSAHLNGIVDVYTDGDWATMIVFDV